MAKTLLTLRCIYYLFVVVCLAIVTLCETDVVPVGLLCGDDYSTIEFLSATVMTIITLVTIPLALRLFTMKRISSVLLLRRYGILRLCLLLVPMVVNTVCYYLFKVAAFGYLAIISLIASVFVYPSAARCQAEVHKSDGEE